MKLRAFALLCLLTLGLALQVHASEGSPMPICQPGHSCPVE